MHSRSAGLSALSMFFAFGAAMASLSAIMLMTPGGVFDVLWRVNPEAHTAFLGMGRWSVLLMFVVGAACALASFGLWRRKLWGHRVAIGLLLANLIGDATNAMLRDDLRTLVGLPVAGALIAYLLSRRVRAQFS